MASRDPDTAPEPLAAPPAWTALQRLGAQARAAEGAAELDFLLVNDTRTLTPYRMAALLWLDGGACSLSGVLSPEANAPYVQWLRAVVDTLRPAPDANAAPVPLTGESLPAALAADWASWWPAHALAVPLHTARMAPAAGYLLLTREQPWSAGEQGLVAEWAAVWAHARGAAAMGTAPWWRRAASPTLAPAASPAASTRRRRWAWAALAGVLLFPVRLTVSAPGELVPAHPVVVRAPIDGVIEGFDVEPNATVRAGQRLFRFDEALLASKWEVAQNALQAAETEYRQALQQALGEAKAKQQLGPLMARIEERRAEVEYLAEVLQRAQVHAPKPGVVLVDDPSEWTGRPVSVGERILRIAEPADLEVEAWVSMADAMPLPAGATVKLYLHANPLDAVSATVRYYSHEAQLRPDGGYAYRVRATLSAPTAHRVGLKGTAKLQGDRVPLVFWVLRRPWASARGWLGV